MKFNCGKTAHAKYREKINYFTNWHKVFLWRPTTIYVDEHGNKTCAWLQFVERKYYLINGCIEWIFPQYREIEK